MPQGEGTYGSQVGRPSKKDSPLEYTPFKMKAKDYGNSPMRKNFGIGDSEMAIKTESPGKSKEESPLPFIGSVFSSGKGIFGRMRKKIAAIKAKRAMATGGGAAAAAPAEAGAMDAADPAMAESPAAADPAGDPAAAEGAVVPHGPESHTGGGGAVGGGGAAAGGVWNVGTAIGEMEGMDRMGQKEYMGGLDPKQQARVRMQQMKNKVGTGKFGRRKRKGIGSMFSDIRLKEKIQRAGSSPSGIPIYEFNYIGDNNRYSGAMAQDLLETNPDAVSMDTSGYYKVNYNNIDVDMHLI